MQRFLPTLRPPLRRRWANLAAGWDHFWFTPADPTPLAAIRICTGLVLLYTYAACTPALLDFIGPHAWVDGTAIEQLRQLGQNAPAADGSQTTRWWGHSVWFYVQQPAVLWLGHVVFLAAVVSFTLGLFSRSAAVVVWLGHLSFVHRGFSHGSGMDTVLAMLTFYLLFAPTGAALSLDRLRQRRRSPSGPEPSWAANVIIRMIQVHTCVIYLFAGLSKLQGARWWDGTAVWIVMMLPEFAPADVGWLAGWGEWPWLIVSQLGVLLTLGLEISFVFLIWQRPLRPVLLFLAVLMHGGIGLFMGMGPFGAAMLTGCLSFVAPATLVRLLERGRIQTGQQQPAPARDRRRRAA